MIVPCLRNASHELCMGQFGMLRFDRFEVRTNEFGVQTEFSRGRWVVVSIDGYQSSFTFSTTMASWVN